MSTPRRQKALGSRLLSRLSHRIRPLVVLAATGMASIVAGGLVTAASAAHPTEHASWAAGYLVLVGGVATLGIAAGLHGIRGAGDAPLHATLLAVWQAANILVLCGVLLDSSAAVLGGGILLFAVLVAAAVLSRAGRRSRPFTAAFFVLLAVLAGSVPVGIFLALFRA